MKIIVTGSLGNISRPLTQQLVAEGHQVVVVSSDPAKFSLIASLGAIPAIGSIADPVFLTDTFKQADALYAMIPLSVTEADIGSYLNKMAENYVQAIRATGLRRVVVLSGWVADLLTGENVESAFEDLDASLTILRPAVFYSNFYQYMGLIRGRGLMGQLLTLQYSGLRALLAGKTGLIMGHYGAEDRVVFVSPEDIAAVVARELILLPEQRTIRYIGSEEMTCNEAARIIGTAIGKPWLKWVQLPERRMLQGLKMAKTPAKLAETLIRMQAAIHSGKALENFHRNHPTMGRVKLTAFASEFAQLYHRKT